MRLLIVSDIHGNLEALEAVLAAPQGQYDRCLCLGDVVGYGADPNACVALLRERAAVVVRGNHDRACADPAAAADFNPTAGRAAEWTHRVLEPAHLDWLRALPAGPIAHEGLQLAHGSPLDEDEYVTRPEDAAPILAAASVPLTVIGHTHLQGGFIARERAIAAMPRAARRLQIEEGARYLLNPGSVGQPRDRDPRAAAMLFDTDAAQASFLRVDYDIRRAQEKIRAAGLPPVLAERLAAGW